MTHGPGRSFLRRPEWGHHEVEAMRQPRTETIRNIALVSYTGAGKTSLAEALLYTAGAIPAIGSVTSGTTVSDYEPEEVHRKISVSSAVLHCDWKESTLNLVDTPGGLSFLGETQTALRAVDGAVIVLGASAGVRTELEKIWNTIKELRLPCLLFVNELDKERSAWEPVLEGCEKALGLRGLPVVIPIGRESQLEGVVDLVAQVAYRPARDANKVLQASIPSELTGLSAEARKNLVEGVAEPDDQLVEKYLADGDLSRDDIMRGLQSGTLAGSFVPVVCGSAARNIGTSALLDALIAYLPSPRERATISPLAGVDPQTGDTICDDHSPILYPGLHLAKPAMSFALEPKSKADVEKVSLGLHKLVEEDPTLEFVRNQETKEMILSGMGQLHVDVTFEKLRRKYGAEVNIHTPKVPYKETIRKMAQAQGKYKKQTGGHGQYGDCWLQLDPLPRGAGFTFENKIVGGAIPRNFVPAVEKGVVEALHEGSLAGFPVVDLRVTVYDGSYHTVDSSEMSFKIAASMGFKKAMEAAHPVLLEPVMSVEVTTPDEFVGAVIGDLNSRRGRILGVIAKGSAQSIKALVPLAEMLKYTPSLNSLTGGRGTYLMEFSTYEEVPREHPTRVIEEHKTAKHAVAQ